VRQSYCARSWYRLDVCPSVRLSVTRWHCVETAQPIVKLSSLPDSPMVLVFWGPNLFPEFQWEHPNAGVKCKGVGKSCNFWLISFSIHVTFTAIFPVAYSGETKMCKNVLKWRTFELTGWITGKQLKIDGYMLQCVWQALNPLFIHVTFTAIAQGRIQGTGQYCYTNLKTELLCFE